jgi:hypothetical protein
MDINHDVSGWVSEQHRQIVKQNNEQRYKEELHSALINGVHAEGEFDFNARGVRGPMYHLFAIIHRSVVAFTVIMFERQELKKNYWSDFEN